MEVTSKKPRFFQSVLLLLILSFKAHLSIGSDTISPGQSLSGNQTIISEGGVFELGFFTPGNSQNFYIGIWYKRLPPQTVVWVANRNQPVSDLFSSALELSHDGNLVLFNQDKTEIWSKNSTSSIPNSTIAMLLDNGNFVIRNISDLSNILWQSFDHPTDTWLPGGKLGYNNLTNEKQILTSWKNSENPAPGLFSLEVETNGTNVMLLWKGSKKYWTSGPWIGRIFSGFPEIETNEYMENLSYVSNENERYFSYASTSAFHRVVVDVTGQLIEFVWMDHDLQSWAGYWTRPRKQCEVYAFCGAFSSCNQQSIPQYCECIQGFEPRMPRDWELEDHSEGCMRKTPLQCNNGGMDMFFLMPNTSFPMDSERLTIESIEDCELACLSNCSCTAYAYDNGCFIWKEDLFNLQQLSSDDAKIGKSFHVRIAASKMVGTRAKGRAKTSWIVIGSIGGFLTLSGIVLVTVWRRRQFSGAFEAFDDSLQIFKYQDLRRATKNFSDKLGEGGFGSVFRGTLPNTTCIAVKKLKDLKQAEKQFRAEVSTIGMIQHINLVRLRGFCAEASKRFLVYDYMSNGSLESYLSQESKILNWKTRYHIAIGTAKGLAYLHEKCRDSIIHCDIKPENILLDAEYNPKVADFGLAKLLGRDFSRVLTTMRGTMGYLAPEWISGEAITPKADVFSYGMLLFEVISGRRNRDLLDDELSNFFPTQVVNTINKGEEVLTLLDYRLEGNANKEELTRACKVACWCIQDDEKDRPPMGQVVQILEGFLEVGMPSIPRFIQRLAECPVDYKIYQESSSS